LLIEPFVNKNVDDCCNRVLSPFINTNRESDSGNKRTLPLTKGRIFKVGGQLMNAQI
jgi:hypothetical protein